MTNKFIGQRPDPMKEDPKNHHAMSLKSLVNKFFGTKKIDITNVDIKKELGISDVEIKGLGEKYVDTDTVSPIEGDEMSDGK